MLSIRDNGLGISEELQSELFTRYMAASQINAKEESTGLGLAICKKIADRHGATISVASEILKGTEVIVTFPRDHF